MKFKTKEEYMQFLKSWAKYFNTEATNLERNEYGNKIKKLRLVHFVMYAIIRDKDPKKCFESASPATMTQLQLDISAILYCISIREELPHWFKNPFSELSLEGLKAVCMEAKEVVK